MPSYDIAQMPNGEFQVHRVGCADLAKSKYSRANVMRIGPGVNTLRDIVLDIYPPDDFDYDGNLDWERYADDVRVIGCAGHIPTNLTN